jgi:predicted nuclease of predicted toxin-antitoxin system
MGLRFFADHCVSNAIMHTLREAGHEVVRLREHVPVDSPDADVIAKAQETASILVSLDGDFADIVTYPPINYRGIVALQVRNHPEIIPQPMGRLLGFLSSHPDGCYYRGKLLLVEVHRIRIRQ